jgi:Zn-dependent peptidase ImmA (M78 family)
VGKYQAILQAESAARDLLRKHGITSSPTDLKRLCSAENISWLEKDLDDELSGMAFIRNGQRFVIVNSNHHENRRRFTMAHEMGHHVLHSGYLAQNVHVDTTVLRRDELSAEGIDLKEIGANAFAAEILMPRSQLLRFSALDLADETSVTAVAQRFGVSATALTYRITNLTNRD